MPQDPPKSVHVRVAQGPEQGLEFSVQPEGSRIGRSSSNDITLSDPSLSRFQCRLFFKDGQLWVADLGSTNETLVNDRAIHEVPLGVGDRITIGETTIEVTADRIEGTESAVAAALSAADGEPSFDLGFRESEEDLRGGRGASASGGRPAGLKVGWVVAAAAVVVFLALAAYRMIMAPDNGRPLTGDPEQERTLVVRYERVEAAPDNIFRYELELEGERLRVRSDNLDTGIHRESEAEIPEREVADLRDYLGRSGFFALPATHESPVRDMLVHSDISITVGRQTHRVRVVNRMEPSDFQSVQERLDRIVRNHMPEPPDRWTREERLTRAREAFLLGKKHYDERRVRPGNLYQAIQAFRLVEWYLGTVEPKPDIYRQAVEARQIAEQELDQAYDDHLFRVDQAIRLRNWSTAVYHLGIILELIPDRGDPRHREAEHKLINAERRLRSPS